MSELLYDMEPMAVEWGVLAVDYWLMTFNEIMIQVAANKKRKEYERKEKAMFDYKQAQLNSYAMNDPKKMPKIEKMYSFFEDESESEPKQEIAPVNKIKQQPYDANNDKAVFMQMAAVVKEFNSNKE